MSDDRKFVDSNILLYPFIQRPDEDKRHESARNLIQGNNGSTVREALNKLVRQGSPERSRGAYHKRNQPLTVRPELVEGLIQRYP